MVESLKLLKAANDSEQVVMLWILKLTLKLFTNFNTCPLRKLNLEDVQGFLLSINNAVQFFDKTSHFILMVKISKCNYNV